MDLLLAGLTGVAVGALATFLTILYFFQKRSDRDLIERRVRTCAEYLDCLGDLERAFAEADGNEQVLEQAWQNARDFCREFRLTGWILKPEVRNALAEAVQAIEGAERAHQTNGAGSGGREAQILCEKYHEIARVVQGALVLEERAFREFRFLPDLGAWRNR